jgi:hypothetical protein
MSSLRNTLIAAAVIALASATAACGVADPTGLVAASAPKAPPTSCVIGDVSGSTNRIRSAYIASFRDFATALSKRDGQVCLMLAGGDPTETRPMFASLAAAHPDQSLYAPGERDQQVAIATAQLSQMLQHPPVENRFTALLEALDVVAPALHPGSTCLVLSDGIQNSPVASFYRGDLSATGIQRLLTQLSTRNLLPTLTGVTVEFPLALYDGPGGAGVSAQRQSKIEAFWQAWAAKTGARLAWGAATGQ